MGDVPHVQKSFREDLMVLVAIALVRFVFHLATNGAYGFHRDELAVLDDARHLDWGYVAYPPFTPFVGRIALELFGLSMTGVRLFGALAQCAIMVMAGLMTRHFGGTRKYQVIAALAAAIAPMSLIMTSLFQYITFDALWWVAVAFLLVILVRTENPRWWMAIGAAIGLGMMTKYTMAFWVVGLVAGVLFTPLRRYLRSGWLWAGVLLSLAIFLPNLLWQVRHDFVSLEFLSSIHERDVAIGRTDGFVTQQFYVSASIVTAPLWLAGLWFFLFDKQGRQFRVLGWMYLTTFFLILLARGRFYYLAPAYPMLLAGGAVMLQRGMDHLQKGRRTLALGVVWALTLLGAVTGAMIMLPLAPIGSPVWGLSSEVHDNFREQLGWEELTGEVARIYHSLSEADQRRTGIYAGNYGEAGAINFYGSSHGLPTAISGINSYWYRGYDHPPPDILIIVGGDRSEAETLFRQCDVAGRNENRYGVENEESRDHPLILLCREPLFDWEVMWEQVRSFG